jgi:hypothetical protein
MMEIEKIFVLGHSNPANISDNINPLVTHDKLTMYYASVPYTQNTTNTTTFGCPLHD